ncbi:DUF4097 domain-containing protein [Weissella coleopterorum]|uniref:DUF4097 domain-containing protein n=1 Tax=Weissella coleopterorum TaxID=2714949 RepID=A0A6G8AYB4_9LACO|nr:DUF4097 family beta strand repeat-containing protein [Weissella coleopterorum]QIL49970.1 DUF4097 domain-containing protein [Weissella coleopterorum]
MNKVIRSIISGFVLMGLGIVLMIFGSMNGGGSRVFWHHGNFWVPDEVKIHQQIKGVQNITIQGDTLDVLIQPDAKVQNGMSIEGNLTNQAGFKVSKDQNTLKLNYQNMKDNMPNFSDVLQDEDHLTIKVPQGTNLKKVKINVQSGNVELKQITAQKAHLKNVDGQIKILQGNLKAVDLNNNDGSTRLDGLKTQQIRIDTGAGNINLHQLKSDKTQVHIDEADLVIQKSQLGQTLISINRGMTTIHQVTAQDLFAQSIYGNYNLQEINLKGASTVATQSGNINVNWQDNFGYRLVVQDQGKIKVKNVPYAKWYQTKFERVNRLTLTTYRGDIMVAK